MMPPLWLIAEREFRTYVATLSFWAALAMGPIAMMGGLFLVANMNMGAPVAVNVVSSDPHLKHIVEVAVKEAAFLDGHPLQFGGGGKLLTVFAKRPDLLELDFPSGFPLSPAGRALVARSLERDAARVSVKAPVLNVREGTQNGATPRTSPATVARLVLMAMLWLTLTGSLGMLLQTVVRERASRSLESLLVAAEPWQIMVGKLAGVGGVSLLVVAAWFGSSEALALFLPRAGLTPPILAELVRPGLLLRAAIIYCLAYAFYGSVTVSLGAMARDSASAQNLSRPMFIVLMTGFFVALASVMGGASVSWLLYVPLFTPFLMLVYPAGLLSWGLELGLFALMAVAIALVARFAITRLTLLDNGAGPTLAWLKVP